MFQVMRGQNLSQESVPVEGIMFKFLSAGSSADSGEVHFGKLV